MLPWPWPAPNDDGGADHLRAGLPMPDVSLRATGGGSISVAQTAGRCVVVFYPWTGRPGGANPPDWDNIPGAHGSTPELLGFARLHHGFTDVGVRLFGASAQTGEEQDWFAAEHQLPFPLLSDASLALRDAMKLPVFVAGGTTYLSRLTLVLRDGRVERVYYPVHPPDAHAREVMYLCGATRPGANTGR